MTSTSIRQQGTDALGPDAPDEALAPPARTPHASGPRRRPARFPSPAATHSSAPDGPLVVRWSGEDEALRELIRDHASAVGMELADAPHETVTACLVVDVAHLERADHLPLSTRLPLLVVTASTEIPGAVWERALAAGALAVLPLPARSEELLSRLAELARPRAASRVIAVAGGCGGAGASSFAARLAAAARRHGPTVLIDADPLGGGLNLLVEEPVTTGIGWADVGGLGPDDGEALREGLPRVDDVSLLVASDHIGPAPEPLSRVLTALDPLGGTVVVDLADELVPIGAELADELLLLVPTSDHAVRAAARRLRAWQLPDALTGAVVRRRGPLTPREVCEDLALPLVASFRDSPASVVPLLDVRRRGADRAARRLMARLHQEQQA